MVTHEPLQLRKKRRHWLLALIVLALGVAWYWRQEEPTPPEVHPAPVATREADPTAPLLPPPSAEPDAAVEADDNLVPARRRALLAPPEPDVEEYMRRWKAALAPLLLDARSARAAELLRASPREQADGGVQRCRWKWQRLEFTPAAPTDLVVVVDTSGSMIAAVPKIARWLGELEYEIVRRGADVQLLVVAEQRDLRRVPRLDGGTFNREVGSNDALDVLIEAAKPGDGRWVDALRPGAELQIVVVTDDAPRLPGREYVTRLTALLAGTRFRIHLLGGLQTAGQQLLAPGQPNAERVCHGEDVEGVDPGEAYQDAVRLTNGLRAPLCYAASRELLAQALLEPRPLPGVCGWVIESPGHRVDRVDALGHDGRAPAPLLLERTLANCPGTRRSYRLADSFLALCEDTCVALGREGYDALEVKLTCVDER